MAKLKTISSWFWLATRAKLLVPAACLVRWHGVLGLATLKPSSQDDFALTLVGREGRAKLHRIVRPDPHVLTRPLQVVAP
jgi:hypothetical protein